MGPSLSIIIELEHGVRTRQDALHASDEIRLLDYLEGISAAEVARAYEEAVAAMRERVAGYDPGDAIPYRDPD